MKDAEMTRCNDPSNALLPWYLNGSLGAAEEESVRSHLTSCRVCFQELEELAEFAIALEGREAADRDLRIAMAAKEEVRATAPARWRSGGFRAAVAALLVAAAILAFYAIRIGGDSAPPGSAVRGEDVVMLDLRSGPTRGDDSSPTLVLGKNVREVELRLTSPVNPEAVYAMELRSEVGEIVFSRPKEALRLDSLGRASYRIPSSVLSPSGNFILRLQEFERSGEVWDYPYPFRVVSLP